MIEPKNVAAATLKDRVHKFSELAIKKYYSLDEIGMEKMMEMVLNFSQSTDLATSFVSVGVLHALGQRKGVAAAYRWANTQEDAQRIISHFEIGKSVADYFSPG